jgi:NADH:ubiquinone oxidoreductase subunit 5 (subunit L)/multisubunit Na+/H+ antiporter MnhA subunit
LRLSTADKQNVVPNCRSTYQEPLVKLLLILLISLPFVGSAVAALLPANARNAEAWLTAGVAIAEIVLLATCYDAMANREVLRIELEWLPEAGLNFVLRVDGFAGCSLCPILSVAL